MYNRHINTQPSTTTFVPKNQRDILLDISENLSQLSEWMLNNFLNEQKRIALYFTLTRKDINALLNFPLNPEVDEDFKKSCESFSELEKEYQKGNINHQKLAEWMDSLKTDFTKTASLI